MFDYIIVKCPVCGERLEFQSKVGDCLLKEYTLDNAPPEILIDIAKDSHYCNTCKKEVKLSIAVAVSAHPYIS